MECFTKHIVKIKYHSKQQNASASFVLFLYMSFLSGKQATRLLVVEIEIEKLLDVDMVKTLSIDFKDKWIHLLLYCQRIICFLCILTNHYQTIFNLPVSLLSTQLHPLPTNTLQHINDIVVHLQSFMPQSTSTNLPSSFLTILNGFEGIPSLLQSKFFFNGEHAKRSFLFYWKSSNYSYCSCGYRQRGSSFDF